MPSGRRLVFPMETMYAEVDTMCRVHSDSYEEGWCMLSTQNNARAGTQPPELILDAAAEEGLRSRHLTASVHDK